MLLGQTEKIKLYISKLQTTSYSRMVILKGDHSQHRVHIRVSVSVLVSDERQEDGPHHDTEEGKRERERMLLKNLSSHSRPLKYNYDVLLK